MSAPNNPPIKPPPQPQPTTEDDIARQIREITQAVTRGLTSGSATRSADPAASTGSAPSDGYRPIPRPSFLAEVQDASGNRGIFGVIGGRAFVVPIDPEFGQQHTHLYDKGVIVGSLEGIELPENMMQFRDALRAELGQMVRVALNPQAAKASPLLDAVVRLLAPLDIRFQDGLRALLSSPQFQQLFAGGKLAEGATNLLPNYQLLSILLPQNSLSQNAEATKALLIAQGLPASLIQHIPDQALAGALNSLFTASQQAAKNPLLFLQSISSVFTLAGVPVQQVQGFLLGLLQEAQAKGIPTGTGKLTPEGLELWASRLMAANNPQILGLNQLVQENFGAGVTKILNAFIRVFFGGALMQGQMPWPQAVPNERMLAELSVLFAKQHEKPDGSKAKAKPSRKRRGRRADAIEGVEHARVERKEDIGDEPPLPPQMSSVFIDVDSDDV